MTSNINPNKLQRIVGYIMPVALAVSLSIPGGNASAKGEDLYIEIIPLLKKINSFEIPETPVQFNVYKFKYISARSDIFQADRLLESKTLFDSNTFDDQVLRNGEGIVDFRSPHSLVLKRGVYAQRIDVSMDDGEVDQAVQQTLLRYFKVDYDGIVEISSTEYSNTIEPPVLDHDEFGKPAIAFNGSAIGAKVELPKVLAFDRQEDLAAVEKDAGDRSEENEP